MSFIWARLVRTFHVKSPETIWQAPKRGRRKIRKGLLEFDKAAKAGLQSCAADRDQGVLEAAPEKVLLGGPSKSRATLRRVTILSAYVQDR